MRAARWLVLHPLVLAIGLGAPTAAPAGSSGTSHPEAQLVMLAEPQPPGGIATSTGAITLPYRVVEVFSGEPGSASVVVRHSQLDPMDRARLASGERVIVMARPDADSPGRWVGSAPLRATDEAVAAFRKWGAPSDVREARPLSEVVAVAGRAGDESVAVEPAWHDVPTPDVEATPAPVPHPVPSPALPFPSEQNESHEHQESGAGSPTFRDDARPDPSLLPAHGPGLPPPPTRRILGPPATERDDLKSGAAAKG